MHNNLNVGYSQLEFKRTISGGTSRWKNIDFLFIKCNRRGVSFVSIDCTKYSYLSTDFFNNFGYSPLLVMCKLDGIILLLTYFPGQTSKWLLEDNLNMQSLLNKRNA